MDNIRTAILRAADSIEMNPGLFDFGSIDKPGCETPGCALGWIGVHLEIPTYTNYPRDFRGGVTGIAKLITGKDGVFFYGRMHNISHSWKRSGADCAKALRLYADKYHPKKEREDNIPQSIRNIFIEKIAA